MSTRNRRRNASGRMDRFWDRRTRYMAVLMPLGLGESFARMPVHAQVAFCQQKYPDPVLEFDDTFPSDRVHRDLRRTIEKAFKWAIMQIDGQPIRVCDFFSVITGLLSIANGTKDLLGFPSECVAFLRAAAPLLDRWYHAHYTDAFLPLHAAVIVPLVGHSRLDTRLMYVKINTHPAEKNKFVLRLKVETADPEERRVELDGAARPMYRVGTSNEWNEVKWLSWDGAEFARPGQQLPVYVQSHALRQLQNRANLPKLSPWLECWLYHSLKGPNIIERQRGDLLVEYRMQSYRLGYLVVTPMKDLVAVRTFLFLTMEPSPESRLLRKQLHLSRREVDWLGLCDLAAFAQTDLMNDDMLRHLFDKCGCGHLFELDYLNAADCAPKPFAAEVRKFLGMAA